MHGELPDDLIEFVRQQVVDESIFWAKLIGEVDVDALADTIPAPRSLRTYGPASDVSSDELTTVTT